MDKAVRCGEKLRAGVPPVEQTSGGSQGSFWGESSPQNVPPRCSDCRRVVASGVVGFWRIFARGIFV